MITTIIISVIVTLGYLALMLDGLRAAAVSPLPGPAPQWEEINRRYEG